MESMLAVLLILIWKDGIYSLVLFLCIAAYSISKVLSISFAVSRIVSKFYCSDLRAVNVPDVPIRSAFSGFVIIYAP